MLDISAVFGYALGHVTRNVSFLLMKRYSFCHEAAATPWFYHSDDGKQKKYVYL